VGCPDWRGGRRPCRAGADLDGATIAPFDSTGLPVLFDALLVAGLNADEIARSGGGNALRVLRAELP
jgi:microsomal dipeptidase-like Zn-dependent dipeptidase